jgi:7-carboxy-7-deazaguanine synthase (Cx14CxxC type)
MFYTLQGEGAQTGRASVFCRFTGCNLWSGREADRATSICTFCDTDFIGTDGEGGGKFANETELASAIAALWPTLTSPGRTASSPAKPYVVFTGGEPALQLTEALIDALHTRGFECAVESNGTRPLPANLDWVCISPKGRSEVIIDRCDELKLVYPQPEAPPERFADLTAGLRYLSPLNPFDVETLHPARESSTQAAIAYCRDHPEWRLTLQSHKVVNIT